MPTRCLLAGFFVLAGGAALGAETPAHNWLNEAPEAFRLLTERFGSEPLFLSVRIASEDVHIEVRDGLKAKTYTSYTLRQNGAIEKFVQHDSFPMDCSKKGFSLSEADPNLVAGMVERGVGKLRGRPELPFDDGHVEDIKVWRGVFCGKLFWDMAMDGERAKADAEFDLKGKLKKADIRWAD